MENTRLGGTTHASGNGTVMDRSLRKCVISRLKRCGGNIGRAVVFITTGRPILRSTGANSDYGTLENARFGRSRTPPLRETLQITHLGGTTHRSFPTRNVGKCTFCGLNRSVCALTLIRHLVFINFFNEVDDFRSLGSCRLSERIKRAISSSRHDTLRNNLFNRSKRPVTN